MEHYFCNKRDSHFQKVAEALSLSMSLQVEDRCQGHCSSGKGQGSGQDRRRSEVFPQSMHDERQLLHPTYLTTNLHLPRSADGRRLRDEGIN